MSAPPTDPTPDRPRLPGAGSRRLRPGHRWRDGGGGGGGSDGQVALRMSTWGNDSRLKLTEEAVAAFEQANPGIAVQVENSDWTRLLGQAGHPDCG